MKYIITESRLNEISSRWLNRVYGDMDILEECALGTNCNIKFFFFKKSKDIYMTLFPKGTLEVADGIWEDLKDNFNLDDEDDIKSILKKWAEDTYEKFIKEVKLVSKEHLKAGYNDFKDMEMYYNMDLERNNKS
jgi:hypothetical protein